MGQLLEKRILKLENVLTSRVVPMVAIHWAGRYEWNRQCFENHQNFIAAVETAFKGRDIGPLIMITKRGSAYQESAEFPETWEE
jgi:hypothetical protein